MNESSGGSFTLHKYSLAGTSLSPTLPHRDQTSLGHATYMGRSSKYKLLFAVHDHCEFAEVSVASVTFESSTPDDSTTLQTTDDAWAVPHARKGMTAAIKAFGIDQETLRVSALRVTTTDSTPGNIAVAAFIAAGLYAGKILDPNEYIDNFIHDGRIRFPQSDEQLMGWIDASP